jgi:GntR family transcriptional regulator
VADVLYKLIADALRDEIINGSLAPGDDVPTEAELGARWNASRGPIRNALAVLRSEGLIETTRGRPSRVVSQKTSQPVDVYVPFTRWAKGFGRNPGAHTEQVSLKRADDAAARALRIEPGSLVVQLIRLRLLDRVPTMLERTTFTETVGRLLFQADLDGGSITEYLATHGHVFSGVHHEIDAVAADELDTRLLGVQPGSPLLRLQRTSEDEHGVPFEFSDDRYRPDVVRFTIDATGRQRNGEHLIQPKAADSGVGT